MKQSRYFFNGLLVLSASFITLPAYSQLTGNVGIGTATPQAKLEVKNPGNSAIKIRSNNYTDTTRLVLSNRNPSELGTDFIIASNQETGLNISSSSDLVPNTTASIMLLTPGGNIGIGNPSPASRLDVNGNLNVSGLLKINNNSGIAGQVLVSNGAAPATWQNTALSNTTRFAVLTDLAAPGNLIFSPVYNLNPSNITIGASSITINHTGLYHFEGLADATLNFSTPPSIPPRFIMQLQIIEPPNTFYFELMYGPLIIQSTLSYTKSERFYMDLNITAGSTLSLSTTYSTSGLSITTQGWFTGYLISD